MSERYLVHGDSLSVLQTYPDGFFDCIVTDPPYGLAFMGKKWDHDVPSVALWSECLRVLKPGGHLLSFGGTRTYHRLVVNIEDAGFEIRDMVAWLYGTGFPKSLRLEAAIDRHYGHSKKRGKGAGAERVALQMGGATGKAKNGLSSDYDEAAAPVTQEAAQWQGWGTALKPAHEPVVLARKPLIGTVAENVLAHGTGGIHIDACRIHSGPSQGGSVSGQSALGQGSGWNAHDNRTCSIDRTMSQGRWPANVMHDGSPEVLAGFPVTSSGVLRTGHKQGSGSFGRVGGDVIAGTYGGDTGSAARFFYCAKASRVERDAGLENLPAKQQDTSRKNHHPTVKPLDLMRYLVRLVLPPDGKLLDPFAGSGSTIIASVLEGAAVSVGIEREAEYVQIAQARLDHWCPSHDPLDIF